jgi:hypothetical protein
VLIVRTIFWITAVTVLLPYETVQNRNGLNAASYEMLQVSDSLESTNLLAEYQMLALRRLHDLKEERSALRHLEGSPDPQE